MARHRILNSTKEDTDTTIAVSNNTKSLVLSIKKTGERYNDAIKRICTEYNSFIQMQLPVDAIQR